MIINGDSDALLAIFSNNKVADTTEIADNVLFDLDGNGDIVSIEIMGIKEAETKEGKSLLIQEK